MMIQKDNIVLKVYSIDSYTLNEEKPKMLYHNHNTLEFSYVLGGEMVSNVLDADGKEESLYLFSNQLLILLPFVYHKSVIPNSVKTITMELSCTKGDIMNDLSSSEYVNSFPQAGQFFAKGATSFIVNDTGSIMMRMLDLQKYAKDTGSFSQIDWAKYDLDLKRFFLEIISCATRAKENDRQNYYLRRILSLLDDNFDRNLSMEDVAKSVGISSSYMRALFAKELQTTPKKKQNEIRVKKSCVYLEETNLSIQEIAKTVGYRSVQAFDANFHELMQMTPGEYRDKSVKPKLDFFQSEKGTREVTVYSSKPERNS